jgi:hypothetical protein
MSTSRRLSCLLAAILSASCATLKTTVHSDPKADFSKYRTFQIEGSRLETDAQASLQQEITTRLEGKGLKPSPDNPDLKVIPRLIRDASQPVDNSGYTWWTGGSTAEATTGIPVGTLVVDLVDPARNQLVWRGVATGTVPSTGALRREKVRVALDRLFADFPPKPAAN